VAETPKAEDVARPDITSDDGTAKASDTSDVLTVGHGENVPAGNAEGQTEPKMTERNIMLIKELEQVEGILNKALVKQP
jgi:hypothetical protein